MQDWRSRGITTIHLNGGEIVGANAYQMEMAAMVAALSNHMDADSRTCHHMVGLRWSLQGGGSRPMDMGNVQRRRTSQLLTASRYLHCKHKGHVALRWQYSHLEKDKVRKKTKELIKAGKAVAEFNYQELGNYLADAISRNEPIPKAIHQSEEEMSKNQQEIYPMGHCLLGLMPHGCWYWGQEDGNPAMLNLIRSEAGST